MWFLHRGLPHPAQCDTPGAEVEARVVEEQFLRMQGEAAVLGPRGCEVLGRLGLYMVNTDGEEEQLEGPASSLPVPVQVGA